MEERTLAARAEVNRLTEAITDLTTRLHQAQQLLTRLEITRQTLTELTAHAPPDPADGLPAVYQQILAVLASVPEGLRTKDICRTLGLPDQPKHVEGARAKLKRLVGRGLANEPKPGLFTPTTKTTHNAL